MSAQRGDERTDGRDRRSGGGGSAVRVGLASLVGVVGVTLATWQVWNSAAPARVSSATRADLPGGGPGGEPGGARGGPPGHAPRGPGGIGTGDDDGGGNRLVVNAPGPDGGMRRVEASSVEDAAKQLGITPDELRARIASQGGGGGGPGPGPRRVENPFRAQGETLRFEAPAEATAEPLRATLKRAIEARLALVVDWGTSPVKTADDIADRAATALMARMRGEAAWAGAVTSLGGDAGALPKAGAEGGGGAAAAIYKVFEGAGVDVSQVSARKGAAGGPMMGGGAPSPKGGAGASGEGGRRPRAVSVSRSAGPGGGGASDLEMLLPTGDEFAAVQGYAGDPLPEVEIEVPVRLSGVNAPAGSARLSVVMAPVSADGPWQPAAFVLRIDDGPAGDALMRAIRPPKK